MPAHPHAAIAKLRRQHAPHETGNPFGILVGTSAGAINAAALACHADDFHYALARLVRVWRDFTAAQVCRADVLGVVRTGARWLTLFSLGWAAACAVRSAAVRPRGRGRSSFRHAPVRPRPARAPGRRLR